jgi:hypothetical protein
MTRPVVTDPVPCRNVGKRLVQRRTRAGLLQCTGCRLTYDDPGSGGEAIAELAGKPPGAQQILLERVGHRRDVTNLWLKNLWAVDLAVHCEHSLTGRGAHLEKAARIQLATVNGAPASYLCAVTRVWSDNVHLILVPDDEAREAPQVIDFPIMRVTVGRGLKGLTVTDADFEDHYGGHPEYATCRNLQAAWVLHKRYGFASDSTRSAELQQRQMALSVKQRQKEGSTR